MTAGRETRRSKLGEHLLSRVAKAAMPKGRLSGGGEGVGDRQAEGVQRPGAIAPGDQSSGQKILHRTTRRVKFHLAIVIDGKLSNGNKVLNKLR